MITPSTRQVIVECHVHPLISTWRRFALLLLFWFLVSMTPAKELATEAATGETTSNPSPSALSVVEPEVLDFNEPESVNKSMGYGLVEKLPPMVRLMICVTILLVVPSVSRACRVPPVVGFILTGILFGPYVFGLTRHTAPTLATLAKSGDCSCCSMWSLSLPQVAATIAAALVAYNAADATGHRLINQNVLSSVLVMVLVTAISGPVLTEIFSRKLAEPVEAAVAKIPPEQRNPAGGGPT